MFRETCYQNVTPKTAETEAEIFADTDKTNAEMRISLQ
jgi:hypothetical protein